MYPNAPIQNERGYLRLLREILDFGERAEDRTGVGTFRVFGRTLKFDLDQGFPLLTTKKVHWKSVATEMLWIIQGRNDIAWLNDRGVSIWDKWALPDGTIGQSYGAVLRGRVPGQQVDQLAYIIEELKRNPASRRLVISTWIPELVPLGALPPCAFAAQFAVRDGCYLDCALTQRSGDMFLGVPFNFASYALLTSLIAYTANLLPGVLTHNIADCHIYSSHVQQVTTQLGRKVRPPPRLVVNPIRDNLEDYRLDDFEIIDYDPHPAIAAPVAV